MRSAICGQRRLDRARQVVLPVRDLSRRGHVEAAQDVEQRRLARTGRSQQHDELAAEQIEIDTAERMDRDLAHFVGLGHSPRREDRHAANGHRDG